MIHSVAYGSASKRANQKITDISDLIYDSYKKYNSLSASTIEKLRFKHRIKVVQNLEENAIKNVIRSVQSNSFINFHLSSDEIHELYSLVKEGLLRQQYYGQQIKGLNLGDNDSTPLYESIKIDFESFKPFFQHMSTWSTANNMERLALRAFKFADENNDNLINFIEFLILIILLTKSDIDSRLKLFFCMHQMPLPKDSQLYLDEDSQDDPTQSKANLLNSSKLVLEVGTEANEDLNFFEINNDELAAEANESIVNYSEFEHCSNMSSTSSAELVTYDYPKTSIYDILPPSLAKSSPGQSPMHYFNRRMDSKEDKSPNDSTNDKKSLPTLNLTQFYQLWSTLYDLFDNEEYRLGQTIKKFGLNLLEIAETAAKEINYEPIIRDPAELNVIKNQPRPDLKCELLKSELSSETPTSSTNIDATSTDSFEIVNNQNDPYTKTNPNSLMHELDVQHAITIHYSHFKASLFVEEQLSNFFEKTSEMDELFIKFRNNQQFERTISFSSKD